ncbi:CYTH and CHAD domain-containing protein [Motilimonas pumila]|uniref:CYTH domain-containing protein n=1 Tax=Motilimonas pumila TaxID=2303987 RepID=A0A418YAV7_9GAMM|nr:CYTH and CHAD domain-containing protein [Motilimonas pumila]RJG40092.1 CYTH domain-containing protein [Motilimonas pumila]
MDTEIEIKFFVSPQAVDLMPELFDKYQVCSINKQQLSNVYFDTSERELQKAGLGLRVRCFDDKIEQTIKLSGSVVGGLHQRPEYNESIASNRPELSRFKADIWPEGFEAADLQARINPVFSNDFERQTWLIDCNGKGLVEVAFDLGEISTANGHESICEIELELLKGSEEVLFLLAQDIATLPEARLVNQSKAQRGYALAQEQPLQEQALDYVSVTAQGSVLQNMLAAFQYGLSYWQHHEYLYLAHNQLSALMKMRDGINFIHQASVTYLQAMQQTQYQDWLGELNWLSSKLSWLDEYYALCTLTENKGHFIKKLSDYKGLKHSLKDQLGRLPDETAVKELITSTRYCQLVLNLTQWMLECSKMPQNAVLTQTFEPFAEKVLAKSWQELLGSNLANDGVELAHYMAMKGQLSRNLMVGTCVGACFNDDARDEFRFPWLDILRGIEDLELLLPVFDYGQQLEEGEEKKKVLKWVKRKRQSILHAMDLSRSQALQFSPYWHNEA